MADSGADFSSTFNSSLYQGLPFLKQYAKYKVPAFDSKAINASAFDPKSYTGSGFDPFKLGSATADQQVSSGSSKLEGPADLSKYGNWSPEDVLRYQQAYGDITSKQAAEQWNQIYYPGIMRAKQEDLRLQLAGDIYSPTKAATRSYLAAQGSALANQSLAATMGGEAGLSNALANQLIAAKQPARIGYAGQTFTA